MRNRLNSGFFFPLSLFLPHMLVAPKVLNSASWRSDRGSVGNHCQGAVQHELVHFSLPARHFVIVVSFIHS